MEVLKQNLLNDIIRIKYNHFETGTFLIIENAHILHHFKARKNDHASLLLSSNDYPDYIGSKKRIFISPSKFKGILYSDISHKLGPGYVDILLENKDECQIILRIIEDEEKEKFLIHEFPDEDSARLFMEVL